jgi:hypothetical protein
MSGINDIVFIKSGAALPVLARFYVAALANLIKNMKSLSVQRTMRLQ